MALQNRMEYGFNGYQVPPTPRAARSVRKRCLFKRKEDGQKQMCAFDLLATVAGRMLLDGKFSPHEDSSEKAEHEKIKSSDKNSCYERNFMFTEFLSQSPHKNTHSDELGCAQNDATSRPASGLTSSDCSDKVKQLIGDECKLQLGIPIPSLDANSSGVKLLHCFGSEDENSEQIKTDEENNRNLSMMSIKASCSRNQGVAERSDGKTSHVVSSVDSVNFSVYRDKTARCPVLNNNPDSVKLVDRDYGEEDYSKSFEPGDRNKVLTPLRDGYHRFKKVTSSNHFKEPADTKDDVRYNPDTERCNQKNILKEQRSLKDYPIKKRKLYDCSSDYNQEEGIYCVPQNCSIGIVNGLAPTTAGDQMPAAGGGSGNGSTSLRRNQQVKLRIKSFRVPELYVEIPETATVGCMKRAVMEAVNEVLGNGLRVGVLLQGKKIREDGKTLQQTGISHRADNLGFCLEPNNNFPFPINASSKELPRQVLHDSPQPLARYPPTLGIAPNGFHHQKENLRNNISGTGLKNLIGSSRDDSAPCLDIVTSNKASSESKAIVPLQTTRPDAAALSAIPLRKCKRSESAQRRIRRPFTVAEVEALVQAVEKLGTGRWRDVKLRAFDHAKHRTYVDLKDKWKTLVHTARISPQQRRGEPVPQELLDRVLTAHAYWSQQQAKQQQLKSHTTDTRLVL